ncbi:plasmid transfer protein [Enterobacteriaceae bacterium RIT693]|nr:plasmid transfer protein [Enterobacteriaceae bacterium RIT693]
MKFSTIMRSLAIAGLTTNVSFALAASNGFDARQSAMGGAGVAAAKYGSASLVNPALLAKSALNEKVALTAPALGGLVRDSGNLIDRFDDVKHAWRTLDKALDSGDAPLAAAELNEIFTDISSKKNASANLSVAIALAIPNDTLPVALSINTWAQGAVRAQVSDSDLEFLEGVSNGSIIPTKKDLESLTSRAEGMAAMVTDYGVSLAHAFTLGSVPVGVGVTPKVQRIETWNYKVAINNFNSSDLRGKDWHSQTVSGNVDVGVYADLTPDWTVALSAQNLIENRVMTREVEGNQAAFVIRPQAAVGTAWHKGPVTLTTDFDLTPLSGFAGIDKHQYAAAGAELAMASWAQVRAGYRVDMRGNDHRIVTAGIGLTPGDNVQFDLTAMAGRMRTIGGVAQLTFLF